MEEAENTKSVRNTYTDYILIFFDIIEKIIHWFYRTAKLITTAMHPHDDWLLFPVRVARRPDIQIQAILTLIV